MWLWLGVRVSVMARVTVRFMVGVMVRVTVLVRATPRSTGYGKGGGHDCFCYGLDRGRDGVRVVHPGHVTVVVMGGFY